MTEDPHPSLTPSLARLGATSEATGRARNTIEALGRCVCGDIHTDRTVHQTVHAAVPANTFAIYGNGEDKELTELVPGILNQLGPDSLASLRKLAESYQSMQQKEGDKEADDDEIPDLVAGENFEGESKVE